MRSTTIWLCQSPYVKSSISATSSNSIELMHMIRKGQIAIDGATTMSVADQFYALAGLVRSI